MAEWRTGEGVANMADARYHLLVTMPSPAMAAGAALCNVLGNLCHTKHETPGYIKQYADPLIIGAC